MSEIEFSYGERAFPKAQELFAALAPSRSSRWPTAVQAGWYDTSVETATGSFAVVQAGAGLDDLVGEILRVTYGARSALVYVVGVRAVSLPLLLSRRPFLALAGLYAEFIDVTLEVMR